MTELQALATCGGVIALTGGVIGSSIGIGLAGTAGTAALSEDSGQLRNVIILSSMPMSQTFYGLIILIIVLTTVLGKVDAAGMGGALGVLAIGFIGGFAECMSAIYQGAICASGIAMLPKTRGGVLLPSMLLAVLVELIGVLGLVFSIMALSILKLM